MTILLTGATGFVGRHVLNLLLNEGYTVISLARRRIVMEPNFGKFQTVIADVSTGEGFDQVPWASLDAVVHLAASGVKASHRVWRDALEVNVVGTQRLLTAVKQRASRTPAVFLARTFYEHLIEQSPALLENPYIATKHAGSELGLLWAGDYPGRVILGTFFQVYGPGDNAGNVLSYAARELKAGREAIFGSGKGLRDWIYITDAAAAVVAAVIEKQTGLREIDIGTGQLTSIRAMIEQLLAIAGCSNNKVTFDSAKDRPDVDITLAARNYVTGWRPAFGAREGLINLYQTL